MRTRMMFLILSAVLMHSAPVLADACDNVPACASECREAQASCPRLRAGEKPSQECTSANSRYALCMQTTKGGLGQERR